MTETQMKAAWIMIHRATEQAANRDLLIFASMAMMLLMVAFVLYVLYRKKGGAND